MTRVHRVKRAFAGGVAVALGAGLLSGGVVGGAGAATAATPARGGSLTVLEPANGAGHWASGVGTTTNETVALEQTMFNAIYGQLIAIGPSGKPMPDLARGWTLSKDAKTLTIKIRPGVTFSDGTPFNAAAVAQNWKDDLAAKDVVGFAAPAWPIQSITAPDDHTVVLQLKSPEGAVLNQIQDTLFNWIASPTAEKKEGLTQFALTPVGAGPFVVASDTENSKLVLDRNPKYWEKGKPYLDQLTFEPAQSDETALEAIQSGAAQAYEGMATPQLVKSFQGAGIQVSRNPGQSTSAVELDALIPPFNNPVARQAIYYATDPQVISEKIYGNSCTVSQSFTGPSGLFYEPKVPGYRTYDLAKAKALVKQLGGLNFTLAMSAGIQTEVAEALRSMYQAAGMTVALKPEADITSMNSYYYTKKWQAIVAAMGAHDPAAFVGGVAFRLISGGKFTGIKDAEVDKLIAEGTATASPKGRGQAYRQLAKVVSDKAYAPFICAASTWNMAAKGVSGPGLTTTIPGGVQGPQILWQDVSMSKS